jgi:hypothetical protein
MGLHRPSRPHDYEDRRLTTCVKLASACVFVLAACLVAQDRGGTSPGTASELLGKALSKAHASGSLEYWGVCNFHEVYPDFPKLRAVPDRAGSSLVELLREMFSADPEMRVNQDADGKIRMVEKDVPSDVLDVKIHHLRFTGEYHGPNAAVVTILNAPELMAFRKEHNIGPEADRGGGGAGFGLPSEAFNPDKPSVLGDLHDVTVRQALDYILQTFQGFWLYESCKTPEGARLMYLGFAENRREPVAVQTPERNR